MFENIEHAKNEIRTRTSKILGGYITENLFIEKYHSLYLNREYSKGWWGGLERNAERGLTFFVVKNVLSKLDLKVIEKLQNYNYLWKQLVCEDDTWYVRDFNSNMTIEQYVIARNLVASRDLNENRQQIVGDIYIEQCIESYERQGILQDIASSIYIEDNFLNMFYTISNIDLIGETEDGIPIYIEVKFKNEFSKAYQYGKKLVFGIDEFQYNNLFIPFLKSGMKVMNAILYNDVKNVHNIDTTVIFEFLNLKNNKDFVWKTKSISLNEHFELYTFSSGRTAWNGAGERTVYCIPLAEYRDLGDSNIPINQRKYFPEGGWGKCAICGESKVIRRARNTGNEFMGCLGYSRHP